MRYYQGITVTVLCKKLGFESWSVESCFNIEENRPRPVLAPDAHPTFRAAIDVGAVTIVITVKAEGARARRPSVGAISASGVALGVTGKPGLMCLASATHLVVGRPQGAQESLRYLLGFAKLMAQGSENYRTARDGRGPVIAKETIEIPSTHRSAS